MAGVAGVVAGRAEAGAVAAATVEAGAVAVETVAVEKEVVEMARVAVERVAAKADWALAQSVAVVVVAVARAKGAVERVAAKVDWALAQSAVAVADAEKAGVEMVVVEVWGGRRMGERVALKLRFVTLKPCRLHLVDCLHFGTGEWILKRLCQEARLPR